MINGYALHEIICDAQGVPCDYRFLQVNTAFEKLTGLKREDIIGRTVKEVLPGTEDSWIKTYGQVALNGAPVFFESYSAALGHWYEIHAFSPERGKFAAIFSDTTERKRAEHALRESEAMLRAITDNMSDLVCKVDLAMRFEYCSPSFTRILGYPVNELIGCNAVEFMHPDDRQIMQETHPILLATGRSPTATFRLRHQDGRYLWVEAVGTLIRDERGQPAGKVISGRDITQRREAEEKLRQAMRDLERFNQLMLGREERVLELKWMVNELLARLGEPPRFDVTQPPAADGGSP